MKRLNDWIFHYNIYTKQWNAVKRENYGLLFNNVNNEKVLKSPNFEDIVSFIVKTNANLSKLVS